MKACPIPDHAELQFVQHARTGRVHVLPYRPEYWEDGGPAVMLASPVPVAAASDDALVDAILGLVTTLCGRKGYTAPGGRLARTGREHFEDDALCVRCIASLGGGSARAFELSDAERECS